MNKPVGYLINNKDGLSGEKGLYYDYILASTGFSSRPIAPSSRLEYQSQNVK